MELVRIFHINRFLKASLAAARDYEADKDVAKHLFGSSERMSTLFLNSRQYLRVFRAFRYTCYLLATMYFILFFYIYDVSFYFRCGQLNKLMNQIFLSILS